MEVASANAKKAGWTEATDARSPSRKPEQRRSVVTELLVGRLTFEPDKTQRRSRTMRGKATLTGLFAMTFRWVVRQHDGRLPFRPNLGTLLRRERNLRQN